MLQKKVLIIEEDKRVLEILSFVVGREGYQVIRAADGQTGLRLAQERRPNLVVLDLPQTEPDNYALCGELREAGVEAPIILLFASERLKDELPEPEDRIDWIQKPFTAQELLMRIKVNLWDVDADNGVEGGECLTFGRIAICPEQILVTKDGLPLELSQLEFDLLLFLAREPGKVFSRDELLISVWEYNYLGDMRNVDVTIRRLREKIEDDPSHPSIIVTRRGRGYIFAG